MMRLKQFFILFVSVIMISMAGFSNSKAQGTSEEYLRQIAENTRNILARVNTLPTYLEKATTLILAWMNSMTPENNAPSQLKDMLNSFTQLGDHFNQTQQTMQDQLVNMNIALLNTTSSEESVGNYVGTPPANTITPVMLPYANDLVYSTLLGKPFFKNDPRNQKGQPAIDASLNYIKNAAGINLPHLIPSHSFTGSLLSKARYQHYYNTVIAAESFNGYVLSRLQNDTQFNELQTQLITQATDQEKWFAQISSESIGFVVRQLLLYQSQVFVLLTQSIQLQTQMLAAQAINNALLIATTQVNENQLLRNAERAQPGT
jgi:hypothetical protein